MPMRSFSRAARSSSNDRTAQSADLQDLASRYGPQDRGRSMPLNALRNSLARYSPEPQRPPHDRHTEHRRADCPARTGGGRLPILQRLRLAVFPLWDALALQMQPATETARPDRHPRHGGAVMADRSAGERWGGNGCWGNRLTDAEHLQLLKDLARVKVTFQLRSIEAVIAAPPPKPQETL